MRPRHWLPAACLGLVLTQSALSSAQTQPGFALDRFDPSERGSEWFAHDSLDLRGHLRPAVGVVGSWAYKPLVIFGADGEQRSAIVRHQMVLHPGASLVLADRFRFGVDLPVAVLQDGDGGTAGGKTYDPANKASLGDARLAADVRLLGKYGEAFTLAVGVQFFLPTGKRDQYTGDEKVRMTPRVQIAGDVGMFVYSARLGVVYRALEEDFGGSTLGSEFAFGAAAGVRAMDKRLVIGPELYGTTILVDGRAFEKSATPLELLFGAHYTVNDFRIGLGGGPGITRGFGAPAARGLLSIEWVPGVEEKPIVVQPGDRDGDGVLDPDDACIDVKGMRTSDPKTNGCPPKLESPKPPPDRDKDGVVDDQDVCIDVPGVPDPDPKKNGCPPDKDSDGIYDDKDACIDVPGVPDPDPKKNGCPPDRDGDTILDPVDACPDAAGPPNPDPKKNGCPAVAIVDNQIKIIEQVKFKTNSAEILKESDEILSAVAKIMKDHPEIKQVLVEGHTDNKGTKQLNQGLSTRRAASVVTWLVKKGGIEPKRLKSAGFGQDQPIDTNDTEEGRQNNRRVEFHILDGATAPPK
jgi:OOP family OmpA-OmpF porin